MKQILLAFFIVLFGYVNEAEGRWPESYEVFYDHIVGVERVTSEKYEITMCVPQKLKPCERCEIIAGRWLVVYYSPEFYAYESTEDVRIIADVPPGKSLWAVRQYENYSSTPSRITIHVHSLKEVKSF